MTGYEHLTPGVRTLGTVMIVFGILNATTLFRAEVPDVLRAINGTLTALLLVFGFGLRARHMWAWWGLTTLATVSILAALFGIVYFLVRGAPAAPTFVVLGVVGLIWGLILWALLRGRQRVPESAEPTRNSGFTR